MSNYLIKKKNALLKAEYPTIKVKGVLKDHIYEAFVGYYLRGYTNDTTINFLQTDAGQSICFMKIPDNTSKITLYNIPPRTYSGGRSAPIILCNGIGTGPLAISPYRIIGYSDLTNIVEILKITFEAGAYKYLLFNNFIENVNFELE